MSELKLRPPDENRSLFPGHNAGRVLKKCFCLAFRVGRGGLVGMTNFRVFQHSAAPDTFQVHLAVIGK
jgi:hypothetical protein